MWYSVTWRRRSNDTDKTFFVKWYFGDRHNLIYITCQLAMGRFTPDAHNPDSGMETKWGSKYRFQCKPSSRRIRNSKVYQRLNIICLLNITSYLISFIFRKFFLDVSNYKSINPLPFLLADFINLFLAWYHA